MSGWIYLYIAVAANISANACFKMIMASRPLTLLSVASSAPFWFGVLFCIILFASYLLTLAHLPLSISYSAVTILALIGVNAVSAMFFGEILTPAKIAGIALAISGIVILLWEG